MTTATTKTVSYVDLKVGNVTHFYGARFEIVSTRFVADTKPDNSGDIIVAIGKWIDGEIVPGYFGPSKDWNFQGNKNARVTIES